MANKKPSSLPRNITLIAAMFAAIFSGISLYRQSTPAPEKKGVVAVPEKKEVERPVRIVTSIKRGLNTYPWGLTPGEKYEVVASPADTTTVGKKFVALRSISDEAELGVEIWSSLPAMQELRVGQKFLIVKDEQSFYSAIRIDKGSYYTGIPNCYFNLQYTSCETQVYLGK